MKEIYERGYIDSPEPDNDRIRSRIVSFQESVADMLAEKKLETYTTRNGEVIIINFQANQLFAPNDTTLTSAGMVTLKPVLSFLKTPGLYKILLVMHSDDTGSKQYTDELTRCRVNSVFDWMDANGSVDFVVPYALGATEPLDGLDNNSIENRKRNRRLEVYLVPEEGLLALAKKGSLNLNLLKIKK